MQVAKISFILHMRMGFFEVLPTVMDDVWVFFLISSRTGWHRLYMCYLIPEGMATH